MKKLQLILFTALAFASGYAQKLPNVQQVSLRAPTKVNIDGKAEEWRDQLQAYNTTSDISYTISNDNDALFLVIQAKNVNVINTIFGYGFEFAVHKSGRKNNNDKIAVSYPVNPNQWANTFRKNDISGDASADLAAEKMDANNAKLTKLKKIIVSGIPGLDTISIYNDAGILAASQFDIKGVYTVEFAIPLKHLGLASNSSSTFSYHMTVNGYVAPKNYTIGTAPLIPGMAPTPPPTSAEIEQGIAELNARIYARNPRTDFWGEYTLAK